MKIAIDCRYLSLSGLGRFTEGFLNSLDYTDNRFLFIGKQHLIDSMNVKGEVVSCEESPFSVRGLFIGKNLKDKINGCDAFFTPNFIIPYGIKIPIFSVVHDVVFIDMRKETTNGVVDYKIKKHLLFRCMRKSRNVFTVSKFSQNRISVYFKKYSDKICVAYNGVPDSVIRYANSHKLPAIKQNYIVFCGNIKKHKGLSVLLNAYDILCQHGNTLELKIVGEAEHHRTSDKEILSYFSRPGISFTGRLNDEELYKLVSQAKFLIQPSFYEGFEMPPFEAITLRTKPIISDIDVFKEIYGGGMYVFSRSVMQRILPRR